MKKIFIQTIMLSVVFILQGCAQKLVYGTYNPEQLADENLAQVQVPEKRYKVFDSSIYPYIMRVSHKEDGSVISPKGFGSPSSWDHVSLEPSKYTFFVICEDKIYSVKGFVDVDLKAGDNFVLTCEPGKDRRYNVDLKFVPFLEFYADKE